MLKITEKFGMKFYKLTFLWLNNQINKIWKSIKFGEDLFD